RMTSSRQAFAIKAITLLMVLGGWEIAGRYVNPLFLSSPSAIAVAFYDLTASGELPQAIGSSLLAFSLGIAFAIVVGIALGVAMGRVRMLEYVLEPYVNALYSTPSIALIPLFILWFGVGLASKVIIVFTLSVFIVVINTFSGVKNLSQGVIDIGAAFGASERQIFWKVVLP